MRELKLLGICGSLRRQSTNAGLLRAAMAELPEGVSMAIADLSEVPFYNADLSTKPAAILGAGGGMGTSRAQYHLRQVCVFLDLHPLNKPEVFANAFAGAFDADGNLTDAKLIQQVAAQMQALAAWTRQLG